MIIKNDDNDVYGSKNIFYSNKVHTRTNISGIGQHIAALLSNTFVSSSRYSLTMIIPEPAR